MEILATYEKHGWQLRRVLLLPETRAQLLTENQTTFGGAGVDEATFDGLWFSRASAGSREAWELRLIAETPYALFETFDALEPDEGQAARREMEQRMSEITARKSNGSDGEPERPT
jgi:hypothetical protein